MPEVKWNARDGLYEFETAAVRGTLMPGGPRMGIQSLVSHTTGLDWVLGQPSSETVQGVDTARTRLLGLGRYRVGSQEMGCAADLPYEHCLVGSSVVTTLGASEAWPVAITCRWQIADPGRIDVLVQVETTGRLECFGLECRSCCMRRKGAPSSLVLIGEEGVSDAQPVQEWLPEGGAATIRSSAGGALERGTKMGDPADAVGRPLIIVPDGELAYLSMAHPHDVVHMRVWKQDVDGQRCLGHRFLLLGHDLDKGVVFQARVRAAVIDWSPEGGDIPAASAQFFGSEML